MDRWLLVSDLHIPKHNERLLRLLFEVIQGWKPNAIDLVGDIDDAEGTSRWADGSIDESANPIHKDAEVLREFSGQLRRYAPDADIHWHDGNHGWTRHNSYIKTKAKALDGLITPDFLYDLTSNGIIWHSYQDPPVLRLGGIHVHHGVSISKHGGQSVKSDMDDWNISLIRGHSHRQASYRKSVVFANESGLVTQDLEGYEIGHMCDVSKMDYSQIFNWQPGFAIAHVYEGRAFVQLVPVHDNSCVVDGKLYRA